MRRLARNTSLLTVGQEAGCFAKGSERIAIGETLKHVPLAIITTEHAKSPLDVHCDIACHAFTGTNIHQRPAG